MNNGASALYRTRNADRKIDLEWHDTSCNKNMFRMEVVHTIADGDTVVCSSNQTSEKKKYDLSAQSASRKPCSRVPYQKDPFLLFLAPQGSIVAQHMLPPSTLCRCLTGTYPHVKTTDDTAACMLIEEG